MFNPSSHHLCLPNAIYYNYENRGGIFVGSAATANESTCSMLGITHIVSVVNRNFSAPDGIEHLLCCIEDANYEDLFPVLFEALPFISKALERPSGRVIVHCERGASRSVSVVVAYLMALRGGQFCADDVLAEVRQNRRCARPNVGFMSYLKSLRFHPTKRVLADKIGREIPIK